MVLGRRVDYLSPTIYFTDILIVLTVFFWIISKVYLKFSIFNIDKYIIKKFSIHHSQFYILLLFIFLNIFYSISWQVALFKWLKVFEYVLFGYYIYKSKPKLEKIGIVLMVPLIYSSLISIAQFSFQKTIGGPLWLLGERTFSLVTPGISKIETCWLFSKWCKEVMRSYATFSHPNALGGFIATLLPIVFFLQKKYISRKLILKAKILKAIIFYFLILLIYISLVFTFSRSAIFIGFMYSLWLVLKNINISKKYQYIITILVSVIIFSQFTKISLNEESVVARVALNKSSVSIFSENPLLGVGNGNFLVALPKFIFSREINFLQPVHNVYLLLLSELGVFGVLVIGYFVYKIILNKRKITSLKSVYLLSLGMWLVLGFIDHYPITLQQGQILTTLLIALLI
ncbi:O-antigen ligase family protein [Patescibacteria group bacterium]